MPTSPVTTPTAAPHRLRWPALAALLVAEAMNLLDTTIVQVVGPAIRTGLGGPVDDVPWFSAAYTLPFALLLINGGRLGDAVGRRRTFAAGVAGFTVASVACALAPSIPLLLAGRVLQGAAAAAIVPQTFGLVTAMFSPEERSAALGTIGPVMGAAAIAGPLLGAAVTAADVLGLSWRAAFLVNVPLGLAVLASTPLLREDRAAARPRFDGTGTVLVVVGAALVTYPLVGPSHAGPAFVAVGLAVLTGFVAHQRRAARLGRPTLVEVGLFRGLRFPAALLTCALVFAVMNGVMLVVALHAQLDEGHGVLAAGLALLPWTAGSAVASLLAGTWLVPRHGARLMPVGLAVLVLGLAGLLAGTALLPALLPVGLAVGGVGLGLVTVPFFTAALARVRPQETGSAAGLLNAVQQLGATLGTAVLGGVALSGGVVAAVALALATAAVTVVPVTLMIGGSGPRSAPRRRPRPSSARAWRRG